MRRPLHHYHHCYCYYSYPGSAPALLAILLLPCIFLLTTQEFTGFQDSLSSSSKLQIPEVEVEALLVFKANYISKDSQNVLWSWNSSSTGMVCESWVGISCTMQSGTHHLHVSAIYLPSHGLRGSLAPDLGNLSLLSTLDYSNNFFTGSIPSELQGCTSLTFLNLNSNRLTGTIPSELGFLSHLQYLDLGHNQLTGAIPRSLAMCSNLTQLILAYNQLTGPVPAELGQLPLGRPPPDYTHSGTGRVEMSLDLSHNQLSGSLPVSFGQLVQAQIIDLSNNFFAGSIPESLGQLVHLHTLDLSNNNFTGNIPESLYTCAWLFTLNLSNNHLSENLEFQLFVPANLVTLDLSNNNFWGGLQFLKIDLSYYNLQFLNVSFNSLTGVIPTNGFFAHLDASSFQGNPGLCGPILKRDCPTYPPLSKPDKHSRGWLHSGSLLIAFFGIILLVMVLILIAVWRSCLVQRGKVSREMQFIGKLAGAKRYTAQELMEATEGYSAHNLLGQGGHSVVYKGLLADGKIVAVKKMKDVYNGSAEVLLKEMQILSKLRHRNLVQVLGCVLNLDVKALVLEYMANGTLEQYLDMRHAEHPRNVNMEEEMENLSHWEMIIRVATSVAKALAYLHHDYDVPIIHGDVKPSNILFDADMEPHLADLGLAKLIDGGAGTISLSSGFQGSIGYMAPEYALAARITTKVDVYAYGVVLLRMLTGRRATDQDSLHEWVKSKLPSPSIKDCGRANVEEDVLEACLLQRMNSPAHNGMNGCNTHGLVVSLLRMGLACTMDRPSDRPTIQEVLSFLTLLASSRHEFSDR